MALNPTGPPTSKGFLKITARALTKIGITLQCHKSAEIADIKIINVNPPKAKIKVFASFEISNGALGAPSAKYPKTKAVPSSLASFNF